MNPLTFNTNPLPGLQPPTDHFQPGQGNAGSFADFLEKSISDVNQLQTEADQSISNLATGKETDLHKTMIAMEKADVALQLMMQVRNKMISAYEEIARMQV